MATRYKFSAEEIAAIKEARKRNRDKHAEKRLQVMEMSAEALTKRLISSRGRIDAQKLRRGRLDDEDWGRFSQVVKDMDRASFYIDDTPGLTVNEVRSRARRLALQTGGLALIVLDYLQLMSGSGHGSSSENRATEISEISRGLKSLAKEMNVPLIALSQLNRGVDARTDKRPRTSKELFSCHRLSP